MLHTRFGVLVLLSAIFLIIHTALRVGLIVSSGAVAGGFSSLVAVLMVGVISDLYPLAIALGVGGVLVAIIPSRLWRTRWHRGLVRAGCAIIVATALVEAIAEAFFWAEFETRFNTRRDSFHRSG